MNGLLGKQSLRTSSASLYFPDQEMTGPSLLSLPLSLCPEGQGDQVEVTSLASSECNRILKISKQLHSRGQKYSQCTGERGT